jgi:predicted ArsR family transcriptional regulator
MITLFGLRQQQLLTLLLQNKEGLTVEDLSKGLGITDNAVRQHLTALQRDGMVARGPSPRAAAQSTSGRKARCSISWSVRPCAE